MPDEWTLLTNVQPYYPEIDDPETSEVLYPGGTDEELISGIVTKYGEDNVQIRNVAYDVNGNKIPGMKGVFIKK